MTEKMAPLVHLFEDNGAMIMRYGTLVPSTSVGRRLLGVGYPSMVSDVSAYGSK
ncbi:hypothetical protein GP644_20650 [Parasedimentitalea maritima]|uniref:Uncharacterized protein n=1 Tax=Parasedimentitalea maritima TaxID=2578117 RepID=A0A6A4RAE8_9RHOB|nr:hypothetical protein GP644_20650 [Zongyanglinia marina]